MVRYCLPEQGLEVSQVRERLTEAQQGDWGVRSGRLPLHCYFASETVDEISRAAFNQFADANVLAPKAFPSCHKMECEVVAMALGLLNAPLDASGSITSGGTESIILALKAARDEAAERHCIDKPSIVIPDSAHPAFDKGAQLLGLSVIRVSVDADMRSDVAAMEAAITRDTILIAGSAPSLPFGLVDRIEELSDLAMRHGLWLHVDACVGGMLAPFVRELGHPLPAFDFCVPGVRSLSADLHKFGYSAKGASLVLYRSENDQRFQFNHFANWPKGGYFTPTLAGTRSGGPVASAWAVMHHLGRRGYLDITAELMNLRARYLEQFEGIEGLRLMTVPDLTIIAFTAVDLDIFDIAAKMSTRGWYMSLVGRPKAIHQTLNLVHRARFDDYFDDLRQSVAEVRAAPAGGEPAEQDYLVLTY
ncbi:hypothetical protein GW16_14890 [Xanthomonas arboricola pv. celebensis]|nr:hypothetical protein GW16_14890 [Xanthomonas arboricola pv. celebensis]